VAKKPKVLLDDQERWYRLLDVQGRGLVLECVAGTSAQYMVFFTLNDAEKAEYKKRGKPYLDELAADVVKREPTHRAAGRTATQL
jgi:hypothetical protein